MQLCDLRKIVKKALKTRSKITSELDSSFCVFDLAEKLGIELKFVGISSMEGALLKDSKTILLSTLRHEGRIRFTCAHEIGHFIFGHGDHFDELVEKLESFDGRIEEFSVNMFASFLLMPETTLKNGFLVRGWDIYSPTHHQIYTIASWLGVSYSSILNQLRIGLKIISKNTYDRLIKIQPKLIKKELCGFDITSNLLVIDRYWKGRPLDVQVGDFLLFRDNLLQQDGECLEVIENTSNTLAMAKKPGLTRVTINDFPSPFIVRVRKKEYVGRAIFRHLEESE